MSQNPSMWQRIGGLLGGNGTPEEMELMGRQGLLHAGLGILANNHHNGRAGPAIGAGIQQGLLSANRMQMQRQMQDRALHDPAGLREHQALVEAATAGMDPEQAAEFRANAAGVRLGMRGRAPSSSAKTVTFEGADGRTRTGIFDPMQRTIFGPGGEQFSIDEVQNVRDTGPGAGMQPPPAGGPANEPLPPGGSQALIDQVMQGANAMVAAGVPTDQVDAWAQQQLNGGQALDNFQPAPLAPPAPRVNAPNAFIGRRPEDEAAAIEAAKRSVGLQFAGPEAEAKAREATLVQQAMDAAERVATATDRTISANDAVDLLNRAEQLIPISTGSGAGALMDRAGAFVGVSGQGGQAIDALKTIAGQLVAKMPRFEGPQSDRDVQLYMDMAGNLADPGIPRERRLAALQTVRELQARYSSTPTPQPQQQSQPRSTQPAPRARHPQTGQVIELRNGQWVPVNE